MPSFNRHENYSTMGYVSSLNFCIFVLYMYEWWTLLVEREKEEEKDFAFIDEREICLGICLFMRFGLRR